MDWLTISGWVIGFISLCFTFYFQYKNEISDIHYQQKIDSLKDSLKLLKEEKAKLAKTVHDICFNSLLKSKNYPHDIHGLALQREFLTSALQSVQRVAQEFSDDIVFQGEFIYGYEIGAIEKSPDVECVWLLSRDLRPDYDDPELVEQISNNIAAGKKYRYIVPDTITNNYIDRFLKSIKSANSGYLKSGKSDSLENQIAFIYLSESKNRLLFSGGCIAIYEIKLQRDKRSEAFSICGFEEVVVPNEKRGALWRRQDNVQAESLLALFKQHEIERSDRDNDGQQS